MMESFTRAYLYCSIGRTNFSSCNSTDVDNFYARCLDDIDDEVRDRAAMYLKVLNAPLLAETYLKDGSFEFCT